MTDDFYHAFEDRYRGSRDLIQSRQAVYAPFIRALKNREGELHALDLGCGRGEWLELLGMWGVKARGIDLDDAMVEVCQRLGLEVQKANALTILENSPASSLDIISGFHIAEHLNFSDLIALIGNAFKALKPGGLLILETPNSENIHVSTYSFYLDPTHKNPIPIQLLRFLFEYIGFPVIREIRLNSDISYEDGQWVTLNDVFKGVSRDYCVIGQAPTGLSVANKCSIDDIQVTSDITFQTLVQGFDGQLHGINQRINDLKISIDQTQFSISQINLKNVNRILDLETVENQLEDMRAALHRMEGRLIHLEKIVSYAREMIVHPIIFSKKVTQLLFKRFNSNFLNRHYAVKLLKKIKLYNLFHTIYHVRTQSNQINSLGPKAKKNYYELKEIIKKIGDH